MPNRRSISSRFPGKSSFIGSHTTWPLTGLTGSTGFKTAPIWPGCVNVAQSPGMIFYFLEAILGVTSRYWAILADTEADFGQGHGRENEQKQRNRISGRHTFRHDSSAFAKASARQARLRGFRLR